MSTSKYIDRICAAAVVIALLISVLFMNGAALGIQVLAVDMGYEDRLFDTSTVHTIDILIDDWDAFLSTAQSEEYSVCDVVIDGEAFSNVGIRGKGNTSLSTVSSLDSDRYSFKIEFDQYDSSMSYYGLDKLSLNNLIQDNTMMKDYLTYQMMAQFGVAAPLCSYVYITVNGEDWGLYLAVEAVEESFLLRNYGSNYGELYKPDSTDMGGGRGNGMDFSFTEFADSAENSGETDTVMPSMPTGEAQGAMPGMSGDMAQQPTMPENFDPSQMEGAVPEMSGDGSEVPSMPEDFDPRQMEETAPEMNGDTSEVPSMPSGFDPSQMGSITEIPTMQGGFDQSEMGGMMSMGSSDVKLQYIDDSADSYSSIFGNAKTDVTEADQQRLIESLKTLSQGENIESVVDVESVIRYFVVHNFVVNSDSYTGSMVHNYYLYEKDGQLSMIPWDYNLAFGTFQGGDATSMVNDDIDAPLSVTGSDRPMIDWIFASEEYTELYHKYFREFLDTVDFTSIIQQAQELIGPYVEKDPTKFCTYEEFQQGVAALTSFCTLRGESVDAQLSGSDAAVDASGLTLSDMGTMNNAMGAGMMQMEGESSDEQTRGEIPEESTQPSSDETEGTASRMPEIQMPEGMEDMMGQGRVPGTQQDGSGATQDSVQWILLVASVMVLAAGLLFAVKFKR